MTWLGFVRVVAVLAVLGSVLLGREAIAAGADVAQVRIGVALVIALTWIPLAIVDWRRSRADR